MASMGAPANTGAAANQPPAPAPAATTAPIAQPANVAPPSRQSSADVATAFDTALKACSTSAPRPYMVYAQIYDESQRAEAGVLLDDIRRLGINTPGIENVTVTAKRDGHAVPGRWKQTTLIYRAESADCAQALATYINAAHPMTEAVKAFPMPQKFAGASNVLELWIPLPSNAKQ